uniref:Major facilitator superfamily (MFS) profile domain-containing protein n=2 Tax=Parascaris univalens TaxID=6257 RepID=A0A915A784_PARUN
MMQLFLKRDAISDGDWMATENVIDHAATTSNRPTYDKSEDADMLLRVEENESSPLLYGACSLPTVLLDDDRNTVTDVEESILPCTSTLSDGGRLVARETKKRRRAGRKRFVSDSVLKPVKKTRPVIASPFMPIATQTSVDLSRRLSVSHVGSSARERYGYGSISTKKEQIRETDESDEEAEGECEEEDETSSASSIEAIRAKFSALTHKEWATLLMLAVANLCSTVAFSCIAPFYPAEAQQKGMDSAQTGAVFGIFELVMFIAAPILGKYMIYIGSKAMFIVGVAVTGVTAILFGFLNLIPSGTLFFWASLGVRVAESIGDAAFVTSSFAIGAKCFPGRIATVVGVMETFAGLGYTAGPPIGGVLYELGGFQLPFLVLGAFLIIAALLSYFLIEDFDDEPVNDDKGMLGMLRIPVVWIMVYAIVVCAISLSFLDPTLANHLNSFNLSPTIVGLMFLLCGGIYTIAAPLWGMIIDKFECTKSIMLLGSIVTVFAMMLIGPSPLLNADKSLLSIGIALGLLGIAEGALYIPTFQNCLDAVREYGYEDSFQTYGCVSGVFESAFAFGSFFGPTIGGFSVEWIGFPWTTTIIAMIHVIFIIVLSIFFIIRLCASSFSTSQRVALYDA